MNGRAEHRPGAPFEEAAGGAITEPAPKQDPHPELPEPLQPAPPTPESRPVDTHRFLGVANELNDIRGPRGPAVDPPGNGTAEKTSGTGGSGRDGAMRSKPVPRAARWGLHFNTRDGRDYLRQLDGLGAVLVIPASPDGSLKVVRELKRRPIQLLDEDVSRIPGICWWDHDQRAVASLMDALDLKLRPERFGAFMPLELEDKLARLEHDYAGRGENQIARTSFQVIWSGTKYELKIVSQEPLR